MLKGLNQFIYQNQKEIKSLSISFQNQKELIQQRYRECMFKMIINQQQNNIKFKELKIFDSVLSKKDFALLKQILSSLPRL